MADHLFVLGSGFSKAIDDRMPVLNELSDAVRKKSKEVFKRLPVKLRDADVETILTYLSSGHPGLGYSDVLRNKADYFEVVDAIRDVIEDAQRGTFENPRGFDLTVLIDYWTQHRANVITFNYDTMVEWWSCESSKRDGSYSDIYPVAIPSLWAIEGAMAFGVDRSEPRKTFNLFKLHGSINWYTTGSPDAPNNAVYNFLFNRRDTPEIQDLLADRKPMIVAPVHDKTGVYRHELITSIWRTAKVRASNATRITIIGYSCPKTDLSMRIFLTTLPLDWDRVRIEVVDLESQKLNLIAHYNELFSMPPERPVQWGGDLPAYVSGIWPNR